jgi:hypothetical protein
MTRVLVWNVGIASNQTPIDNFRIQKIVNFISLQNPDICVLMDAFELNVPAYLLEEQFLGYTIITYPLQIPLWLNKSSYCVLIKGLEGVSIDAFQIEHQRYVLEIKVDSVKILVAYLEYADHRIRRQQLNTILSLDVDSICGDLNTFFRNVPREYFGNPLKILNHWKQIGLYICSKQVRNMHVPRRVLSDRGWILMSKNQYSFPLPFFWKTFLRTPLLKRTELIWKVIFNDTVLDPDNVLARDPGIFEYPPSIITKSILNGQDIMGEASDHGAIYFEV